MEGYYEPLIQLYHLQRFSEAATGNILQKTVFLEVSKNSQDECTGKFTGKTKASILQLY